MREVSAFTQRKKIISSSFKVGGVRIVYKKELRKERLMKSLTPVQFTPIKRQKSKTWNRNKIPRDKGKSQLKIQK